MFPFLNSIFGFRIAAKRPSRMGHKNHPVRPQLESLEDRWLPANLAIVDVSFVDGYGNPMTVPTVGTLATARVAWNAQGMPTNPNAQFAVKFTYAGGSTTSDPISSLWSSNYSGVTDLSDWLVKPGWQTLTAELVHVTAFNEPYMADNLKSVDFAPATFQSEFNGETNFVTPIDGTPFVNWTVSNYVDLDPRKGDDYKMDYTGATGADAITYDGHNGLDLPIAGFDAMDAGVPVFAAASGVVVDADDGHFDRNTTKCADDGCTRDGGYEGNHVVIDHGNGWQTVYAHFREFSVAVKKGDVVKAGDPLGLVGSSGNSTGPHLHFGVYHLGRLVEPYMDPSSYWVSPVPYAAGHDFAEEVGSFFFAPRTQLLSYNGDSDKRELTVSGAPGNVNDTITLDVVGPKLQVVVNGQATLFPLSRLKAVTVNAGDGKDTINVLHTPPGVAVKVDGGAGDDTVNVGGADPLFVSLGSIKGSLAVYGGAGTDTLNLQDQGEQFGQTYTLNYAAFGSTVARAGVAQIWYDTAVDKLQLNTGPDDDTININSVATGMAVTVNANGGDDQINVGNSPPNGSLTLNGGPGDDTITVGDSYSGWGITYHTLDTIQGPVTVHGNAGGDVLQVMDNDQNGAGKTYELSNGKVKRSDVAAVYYDDVQEVDVTTRDAADTINILSTASGVKTKVYAGGGDDTITVGRDTWLGYTLDDIHGPLTIDGGSGANDVVNVLDTVSLSLTGKQYALYSGGLQRVGTGMIYLNAVEQRSLTTSFFDDTVNVLGTATGTTTTVNTGSGNDTVNVGWYVDYKVGYALAGYTLDFIQGSLLLQGGSGALDTVNVFDTVNNTYTGKSYTLNGALGSVARTGAAVITSDPAIEKLVLSTSLFDDTITTLGTATGPQVTVNAGSGNNTLINAAPGLSHTFHITDPDKGDLDGKILFNAVGSLVGADSADSFQFSDKASVSGSVNGGGGTNTLDYSAYTTDILVNLATGSATGVAGGAAGRVSNIQNVIGGSANNVVIGNAVAQNNQAKGPDLPPAKKRRGMGGRRNHHFAHHRHGVHGVSGPGSARKSPTLPLPPPRS